MQALQSSLTCDPVLRIIRLHVGFNGRACSSTYGPNMGHGSLKMNALYLVCVNPGKTDVVVLGITEINQGFPI